MFDTRTPRGSTTTNSSFTPLLQVTNKAATAIATSPLQSHAVLIGDERGCVTELDLRFGGINAAGFNPYTISRASTELTNTEVEPYSTNTIATTLLHQSEITTLE